MEFCGGHTHAIARYGIEDLLPETVRMIHGPGCPVCVLPVGRIDDAVALAQRPEVILCTYGDMLRVPGSARASLMKAKADGADVRMVYSTMDALRLAEENPAREVVFFAIGFETTTPPTAMALHQARAKGLENFSVFCNHVLTPAAVRGLLATSDERLRLDGMVGPSHVSAVIGMAPYAEFARDHGIPVVISGFEPLDVMLSILMLVRQLNEGRAEIENEYSRAVSEEGNLKAQALMAETFDLRDSFEWRGLGSLPHSALAIAPAFAEFDAERRFALQSASVPDNPACDCADIVRGIKRPTDCKLFGKVCTPENPMGSCMVSSEGACAAHWSYGRFRDLQQSA
jgi:hydrogenase expression/formation protein HypD